jgi:hypothetical protein
VWEKYEQDVIAFEKEREIICFAYKWLGEKKVYAYYKSDLGAEFIPKLHILFDMADYIVAHNGDSFDIKMVNTEFIKYGLTPPSPYKSIDTLKVARSKFRFNSNKLDDLGKLLGLGQKINTGGFGLWLACIKGEKKAIKKMKAYNMQDVILLEKVYLKLRGWDKSQGLGHGMQCTNCESTHIIARGWIYLKGGFSKRRFQCMSCGKWMVSSKREKVNNDMYKEFLK